MDPSTIAALRATRAFGIFVDEIARHVENARPCFVAGEVPPENRLRELAAVFHTIKGSAGFFGFSEIGTIAGKLEDLLSADIEEVNSGFAACRDLFSRLDVLAGEVSTDLR